MNRPRPWKREDPAKGLDIWRIIACIGIYSIGVAYILQNNNSSPDTLFYYEVAKNILTGCGFALNTPSGCEPLTGGYFPGYPSIIAATLFANAQSEKVICLLVYTAQVMASLRLAKCIDSTKIVSRNSATLIFAIATISPLHFGFSRFALVEPSLAVTSTVLISEYLLFIYRQRRSAFTRTSIFCILIGIYLKPTFAAIIPILAVADIRFSPGIARRRMLRLAGSLMLIMALVTPWMLRQSMHNSDSFSMYSNRIPPGFSEYRKWTRFITITEYDHASYHFNPGNKPDQVFSLPIPRLHPWAKASDADFIMVNRVLQRAHSPGTTGFNPDEILALQTATDIRREMTGPLRLMVISILQSASLLFHPLNSWGFPIEIRTMANVNTNMSGTLDIASDFLAQLSGKLLLWLYRIQVAAVYLYKLSRSQKDQRTILRRPGNCINILFMTGMGVIIMHLIMYVGLFNQLEHRYISPFAIWIELGPALYVLKSKGVKVSTGSI